MVETAKKEYGHRFLYAEDLLLHGELKSPEMEIVAFHPKNTITPESEKSKRHPKKIDKCAIEFQGKENKILVLATVNRQVLHTLTGYGEDEGKQWVGNKVKLQARVVDAFGDRVVAVRIMPPVGAKLRKSILKRLGVAAQFAVGKGFFEKE